MKSIDIFGLNSRISFSSTVQKNNNGDAGSF